MQRNEILRLSLFEGMTESQIELLEKYTEHCSYPENHQVFKQGDCSTYLFLLLDGEVSIQQKLYDGPKIKIAQILPGGVFGWSCVLGRKNYTSEVVTIKKSETYRITKNNLQQMYHNHTEMGELFLERLAGVISKRLLNCPSEVLSILQRGMEVDILQGTVYK